MEADRVKKLQCTLRPRIGTIDEYFGIEINASAAEKIGSDREKRVLLEVHVYWKSSFE